MADDLQAEDVAVALRLSIGLFLRLLRQSKAVSREGGLTAPESSALSWLDRAGPMTSAELARAEQISPQSMGATLNGLESRRLIHRAPDPADGRRAVLSVTEHGRRILNDRRGARTQHLAKVLASDFTPAELKTLMKAAPLIERLARGI